MCFLVLSGIRSDNNIAHTVWLEQGHAAATRSKACCSWKVSICVLGHLMLKCKQCWALVLPYNGQLYVLIITGSKLKVERDWEMYCLVPVRAALTL